MFLVDKYDKARHYNLSQFYLTFSGRDILQI